MGLLTDIMRGGWEIAKNSDDEIRRAVTADPTVDPQEVVKEYVSQTMADSLRRAPKTRPVTANPQPNQPFDWLNQAHIQLGGAGGLVQAPAAPTPVPAAGAVDPQLVKYGLIGGAVLLVLMLFRR